MRQIVHVAITVLAGLTLGLAHAEETALPSEPPHPDSAAVAHTCLDQKERKAVEESGKVIHLAAAVRAARKRTSGTLVQARLCHGTDGLVYMLTVLARDGKVARLTVDAVKGTLVGQR
jgi:uncharacterized membrane protein YkoI